MFTKTPFERGKEGVWLNLSAEEYHAAPGVSQSTLKEFDSYATPKHYQARKPRVPNEAMQFGTVVHTAVLEPERLAGSYYVRPERFTAGAKEKWLAAHRGKPVITKSNEAAIPKIVERVKALSPFAAALKCGHREVSFFKRDLETGLLLKCRVDVLAAEDESEALWVFDLKKVQSGKATADEFGRSSMDFGYHIQAASYTRITGAAHFVLVPFDDGAPYDACQWEPDADMMDWGAFEYRRILNAFAECLRTDSWPGYAGEIGSLCLPKWARRQMTNAQFVAWSLRVATGRQ
jgi:hypothetical protein